MEIKGHYRPNRVKKYEARRYVDGKAKTRFFATEEEREQLIDNFSEQVARNGTDLLFGFNAARMRRRQEASRPEPDADPVEVMRFRQSFVTYHLALHCDPGKTAFDCQSPRPRLPLPSLPGHRHQGRRP